MINKLGLAAQVIKDRISAVDVAEAIGLEIKHGRCQCPIHGGHDFNCVLYKGNRGFYCHVCKAGGDVVSFVRQYYSMSFKECISWFNSTFSLGMDIDSPMSPEAVKQAENAQRMRKEMHEFQEWKDRMQFNLFLAADRILQALEEQRDANIPNDPNGPWNRTFVRAVWSIPVARRLVEECMIKSLKEKE